MACFHEVVYSEEMEEDEGSMPEDKHWFSDCTLEVFKAASSSRYVTGFRPWFSSTPFRGADDKRVQGPLYTDGGRPVLGNFLLPKKFHVKLCFRTDVHSFNDGASLDNTVLNAISFRLLFMLVWLYPPTTSNEDDEMEFFENWFMLYDGVSAMHAFLKPEVKGQVKILYDAVHTLSSPKTPLRNTYVTVSKAATAVPAYSQASYNVPAYSQAGYIVPPFTAGTQIGWTVPAAAQAAYTVPAADQAAYTDSAVTSALTSTHVDVYGGHQVEVQECIDLEGLNVSTWRDPVGEEENQMVPYIQMFVVTDEAFVYHSISTPTRLWSMNVQGQTCMSFTDE